MPKRVFCALWMAAFAALAGFPTWNPAAPAVVSFLVVLSPAAAGAVTGASLQASTIGRQATLLGAAIVGVLCAALSLPLMIFGFVLIAGLLDPGSRMTNPAALGLLTLFVTIFVMKGMWWSILPMGAAGGLTLQLAWRMMDRRRRRRAAEGASTA